ncbi:MAG: uroporphyrinogen decarboxylase family protein, partial [Gemmatimonadota bacterium]
PEHLPPLEHILQPPAGEELAAFRQQARAARAFCDGAGLLLAGSAPGVGDPVIWMSGVEPVLLAALDEPDFLEAYVEIVARWNRQVLKILIEAGVDVIVRRGWYESTDFWSPALYRRFLFGPLQEEVRLTRQAGVKLSYVMNTGAMPLLPAFADLGFDVLSNLDPLAPGTSLREVKRQIGDRICLCGGVNNNHVLERGSEAEVERAVTEAIEALAPGSGFILAPGDSVGYVDGLDPDLVRRNVDTMIAAWQRLCVP